jgi:hypothetical protein
MLVAQSSRVCGGAHEVADLRVVTLRYIRGVSATNRMNPGIKASLGGLMTIHELFSAAGAVLASIGGGAVIVLGCSNWLGKLWASRFAAADKAKHATEMANLEARLGRETADRTRKLEALKNHYERQVEDFYGPLFNMVHQIYVANDVMERIVKRVDGPAAEKVRDYFHETYFDPFHDQIRAVLRAKLYLVEGTVMPQSFYLYLKHAAQERDQRALYKRLDIKTEFLRGEPWPSNFHEDIESGFHAAMRNYERCLEGLKA